MLFYFRLSSSTRFWEFRKRILALDTDPYRMLKKKKEPIAIAVDIKSKESVAMEISTNDVH
jgi:hypothetical protein